MKSLLSATLATLVLSSLLQSQSPLVSQGGNLRLDATAATLGRNLSLSLDGAPFAQFLLAVDALPGAQVFPGFGTIHLATTPALMIPIDGFTNLQPLIGPTGNYSLLSSIPNSPFLDGAHFFMQAVAFDLSSPTMFSISNAKSLQFGMPDSYHSTLNTMALARSFHQVARLDDEGILIVGGGNGNMLLPVASSTCELYNPYTRAFGSAASMASDRTLHRVTKLQDGRVLASGGSITFGAGVPYGEVYDPATDSWTVTPPMSTFRMAHTATLLDDGRVLLAGGASSFVLTPPSSTNYLPLFTASQASAELYDPVTNTYTPTANDMTEPRWAHTAIKLANGKVLLVAGISGGVTVFGFGAPVYSLVGDIFDPATNTFTPVNGMASTRLYPTLNLLPNGDVISIGGAGGIFVATLGSSEVFHPSTGTWTAGPTVPNATVGLHTATSLPNGDVLVAGGAVGALGAFQGTANCFLYSAAANTITALNPMPTPRQTHTATWTPEGVILIGGADQGNPIAVPPIPATAVSDAILWHRN